MSVNSNSGELGLNLLSLNCRSLFPKIDDLRLLALSDPPDIIAVCETFLDQSISSSELAIANLTLIRRDRNRHGGGVALYIREDLPFRVIIKHPWIELLVVQLSVKKRNITCGIFYRPPSSNSSVLHELEAAIESLPPSKLDSFVLMGDLNINFTSTTSSPPQISSIMDKISLRQIVSEPTRCTITSTPTVIDHVYLSEKLNFSSCNILPPIGGSDHNCVSVSLQLSTPKLKSTRRQVWLYKKADFVSVNDSLHRIPSSMFPDDDVDNFWSQWYDLYMSTMSSFIPKKTISSHKQLPYISKDLLILIRKKQRLFKQAKRLNSHCAWLKYNKARNKTTSALRKSKQHFFTKLSMNVQSPRDFWSDYYKLFSKRERIPDNLTHETLTATNSVEKASLLNKFFSSCFGLKPSADQSTTPSLTIKPPVSLSQIPCSVDEVFKLLSTYKARTSSGPDGISSTMLRNTAATIAPHLATLFNLSLQKGKVPTAWKISNITPIHKSGDKFTASNYRPISLLSLVSKILERIIHNRINSYLSTNNILSNQQFGFRSGFSTQEALLSITNNWHSLLSSNRQVTTVFFDVKKAFDSVPHHLILKSLSNIGISGPLLAWISNYLTDRQQRVVLDGTSSSLTNVTSGVPQGSILGPLLFICFMDSITQLPFSPGSKLMLYADDVVLYRPTNSAADVELLQRDINLIADWIKNNGLSLNSSKTKVMPITRSPTPTPLNLKLGNHSIPLVSSFRYLGVTVTSTLSWSQHIKDTTKTAKRQIGLLHRSLNQATPQARLAIYKSTIVPKLEYCASVWDPHQTTLIEELEKTQRFATKVISKNWNSDTITLQANLKLQSLKVRRSKQRLKNCFNIINGYSCIPPNLFTPHPSPSPRNSHNQIILIPHAKTNSHKYSFFIGVIPHWNCLPQKLVDCKTPQAFKSMLNKVL